MPRVSDLTGRRWQRCRPDCGCGTPNPSRYDKCSCQNGCLRGSMDRLQRDTYALMVNLIMMGGWASKRLGLLYDPLTGHPFYWADGHVDKIGAEYRPGGVVMVYGPSNLVRPTIILPGEARYIRDIAAASKYATVTVKSALEPLEPRKQTGKGLTDGWAQSLLTGPYGTP